MDQSLTLDDMRAWFETYGDAWRLWEAQGFDVPIAPDDNVLRCERCGGDEGDEIFVCLVCGQVIGAECREQARLFLLGRENAANWQGMNPESYSWRRRSCPGAGWARKRQPRQEASPPGSSV